MQDVHPTQRATLARDAALRRLRRLTGALIAGAVALSAVFAGVAASSTHPRKVVRRARPVARTLTTTPPLPPEPAAPAQSAAPAPPPQAPAPTQEPPVVASGGS
jgi:hypothetical protein